MSATSQIGGVARFGCAVALVSLAGCKGCSTTSPAIDAGAHTSTPDAKIGHRTTPDARPLHRTPDARVADTSGDDCNKKTLFTLNHPELGTITVSQADSAFFYKSRLAIDADGAPNAYHPKPQSSL